MLAVTLTGQIFANRNAGMATGVPANYVVITLSNRCAALTNYAAARTSAGITTRVFCVEAIYTHYAGSGTCTGIYHFIRDAYTNWGIDYVLLAGSLDDIPSGPFHREFDNYYALLDGPGDYYQNVYVGRLPTTNAAQTRIIADRWAAYDCYGWGRDEFCLSGNDLGYYAWNDWSNDNWRVVNMAGANVHHGLPAEDVVAEIDVGHGIINWVGHGAANGWIVRIGGVPADSFFYSYTNVLVRTNNTRLPFVNALVSCSAGKFSNTASIARSFVCATNAGAIGYIGANKNLEYPSQEMSSKDRFYDEVIDQYRRTGYVMPGVAFHDAIAGSGAMLYTFNLLGDPTVRMDLRPNPPDTHAPLISMVELSATNIYPGAEVDVRALVTDSDCVGIVSTELTCPAASGQHDEMDYNSSSNRYECTFMHDDVVQPGTYTVSVTARDISQNSNAVAGPDLVVMIDTGTPVITHAEVLPPMAYQNQPVEFDVTVIDNADEWGLSKWALVTLPGGSVVTSAAILDWFFEYTAETGLYSVAFYAQDWSTNMAVVSNAAFNVLGDPQPPQIMDAWVAPEINFYEEKEKISFIDTPGSNVVLYMTVTDNVATEGCLMAMADITCPDGVCTNVELLWQGGSWSCAFCSTFEHTVQTGTYGIEYAVMDQSMNTSRCSGVFYVTDWPLAVVHCDGQSVSNQVQMTCVSTSPLLSVWYATNILDPEWAAVTNDCRIHWTNGMHSIEFTIDPWVSASFFRTTVTN